MICPKTTRREQLMFSRPTQSPSRLSKANGELSPSPYLPQEVVRGTPEAGPRASGSLPASRVPGDGVSQMCRHHYKPSAGPPSHKVRILIPEAAPFLSAACRSSSGTSTTGAENSSYIETETDSSSAPVHPGRNEASLAEGGVASEAATDPTAASINTNGDQISADIETPKSKPLSRRDGEILEGKESSTAARPPLCHFSPPAYFTSAARRRMLFGGAETPSRGRGGRLQPVRSVHTGFRRPRVLRADSCRSGVPQPERKRVRFGSDSDDGEGDGSVVVQVREYELETISSGSSKDVAKRPLRESKKDGNEGVSQRIAPFAAISVPARQSFTEPSTPVSSGGESQGDGDTTPPRAERNGTATLKTIAAPGFGSLHSSDSENLPLQSLNQNVSFPSGRDISHHSGRDISHCSGREISHRSGRDFSHHSGRGISHYSGRDIPHHPGRDALYPGRGSLHSGRDISSYSGRDNLLRAGREVAPRNDGSSQMTPWKHRRPPRQLRPIGSLTRQIGDYNSMEATNGECSGFDNSVVNKYCWPKYLNSPPSDSPPEMWPRRHIEPSAWRRQSPTIGETADWQMTRSLADDSAILQPPLKGSTLARPKLPRAAMDFPSPQSSLPRHHVYPSPPPGAVMILEPTTNEDNKCAMFQSTAVYPPRSMAESGELLRMPNTEGLGPPIDTGLKLFASAEDVRQIYLRPLAADLARNLVQRGLRARDGVSAHRDSDGYPQFRDGDCYPQCRDETSYTQWPDGDAYQSLRDEVGYQHLRDGDSYQRRDGDNVRNYRDRDIFQRFDKETDLDGDATPPRNYYAMELPRVSQPRTRQRQQMNTYEPLKQKQMQQHFGESWGQQLEESVMWSRPLYYMGHSKNDKTAEGLRDFGGGGGWREGYIERLPQLLRPLNASELDDFRRNNDWRRARWTPRRDGEYWPREGEGWRESDLYDDSESVSGVSKAFADPAKDNPNPWRLRRQMKREPEAWKKLPETETPWSNVPARSLPRRLPPAGNSGVHFSTGHHFGFPHGSPRGNLGER
eukprot:Gregarina_sp_Poly_1__1662@NODE_1425_length_4173_cov_13_275938_g948_i0_p1_GENE_NODE_1425_length_4173_cov_13_275938_g948_i0NODE_1425_length_4173_cov_13_275938_g948_i0_p1_ORF_typecomplete_len1026_score191_98DUF2345/PF10106_9/0_0071_NODE_1425_length_4173_cov_13_275938_g948_i09784055